MTDLEAFYYELGGGRFEPTRATESPWDQTAQHGGPPAALLAHLIDATVDGQLRLARLSIDFLGAIPRAPVRVTVESVKPGRRVWLSQAQMSVDERTVAVARTWHIATGPRPPIDDEHTEPAAAAGRARRRSSPSSASPTGATATRSSGGSPRAAMTRPGARASGPGSGRR